MTRSPVAAAPRPLLALLSDAMLDLLDPAQPPQPAARSDRAALGAYAAFEAPTYQRRGIRIAGLEDAGVSQTASRSAPVRVHGAARA